MPKSKAQKMITRIGCLRLKKKEHIPLPIAESELGKNKKSPEMVLFIGDLAEKVGFEPTVMLPPRLISSQVHSTTLPLLLHSTLRLVTAANSIRRLYARNSVMPPKTGKMPSNS